MSFSYVFEKYIHVDIWVFQKLQTGKFQAQNLILSSQKIKNEIKFHIRTDDKYWYSLLD